MSPAERAALAGVSVAIPELPGAVTSQERETLELIDQALRSTGAFAWWFGSRPAGDMIEGLDRVAELARARLGRLRSGEVRLHIAMGRAWLEAGAPGRPGVAGVIEVALSEERDDYHHEFARLVKQVGRLEIEGRAAADRRREESARKSFEAFRYELLLDLLDQAESQLEEVGFGSAWELLSRLPTRYTSGIPTARADELRLWIRSLRSRLRADQQELELAATRATEQELRTLRQTVGEQVAAFDDLAKARAKLASRQEAVHSYLEGVGRKLIPIAHLLANGDELTQHIREAGSRLQESEAWLAKLDELRQDLTSRLS